MGEAEAKGGRAHVLGCPAPLCLPLFAAQTSPSLAHLQLADGPAVKSRHGQVRGARAHAGKQGAGRGACFFVPLWPARGEFHLSLSFFFRSPLPLQQ